MNQTYCPCPKCSHLRTRVVLTNRSPNLTIRRRWCPVCKHRWYSIQHPEISVKDTQIKWQKSNAKFISSA